MTAHRSPAEDNPNVLRLLGLITVRWADAEAQMAALLGDLLSDNEAATSLYYSLGSFRQRQQLVLTLVKTQMLRDEEDSVPLDGNSAFYGRAAERCLLKLGKIWSTRNDFLHSIYVNNPSGQLSINVIRPATSQGTNELRQVRTSDLENHAQIVRRMTIKLYAISARSLLRQAREGGGSVSV